MLYWSHTQTQRTIFLTCWGHQESETEFCILKALDYVSLFYQAIPDTWNPHSSFHLRPEEDPVLVETSRRSFAF